MYLETIKKVCCSRFNKGSYPLVREGKVENYFPRDKTASRVRCWWWPVAGLVPAQRVVMDLSTVPGIIAGPPQIFDGTSL